MVSHSVDDKENMITDGASSTCMDNSDEIDGEEAIDEEDVVVSSRALETVMEKSRALETVMEEFERDIEEHFSSDNETGESILSSPSADATITCNDVIDSTRDKLLRTRELGKVRTVYPSTPISSSSVPSIPLVHSVVIIPRINNNTDYK